MNLYIWHRVDALKRYSAGTVIVMALDEQSALDLAALDYYKCIVDANPPLDAEDQAEIEQKVKIYTEELAGMNAIMHNYPVAINLEGSE